MADAPVFAVTPKIGVAAVSTGNTNRDGTGTIATVLTAATAGTRVERVIVQATSDPTDSVVTLFLHDGTNFWLFDEIDLGNPAAATSTVPAYRNEKAYSDLVLPSGWSLRAAITVAPTAGVVNVVALGADLT